MTDPLPSYSRFLFPDLREELRSTVQWFEIVGRTQVSASRLEAISSSLDGLLLLLDEPDASTRLSDFGEEIAYFTVADARGYVSIWKGLKELPSAALPRRLLARSIKGPLCPREETLDSNDGRNIFAQLELAADLATNGVPVSGFEDVQFDLEGFRFFTECKRLWSSSDDAVDRNLEKAAAQLEVSLDTYSGQARGLIAIAVDRISGLGRGSPLDLPVSGPDDVNGYARAAVRDFKERHLDRQRVFDGRIVAYLVIAKMLVHNLFDNTVGLVYCPTFVPLVRRDTTDYQRLIRLHQSMVS